MSKESRNLPLDKISLQHLESLPQLPLRRLTRFQHRYDEVEDCERDIIINLAFSLCHAQNEINYQWYTRKTWAKTRRVQTQLVHSY